MSMKLNKKHLIILITGVVLICGIVIAALSQKELSVTFDSNYAEVNKELSVVVEGAKNPSYEWSIGGEIIENTTSSYTPTADDLEKWIVVTVKTPFRTESTKLYCSKLPVVYIDTNGAAIESKEEYIDATMTIQGNATYNSDTTTLYDGICKILCAGL